MAASVEFEDDNGQVVRYVRHANGGGLVSPRAWVHEGAMVASTAYVEAGAQVGDRSRIGAGSWLDHDVIVGEDVVVAANVHLGPRRSESGRPPAHRLPRRPSRPPSHPRAPAPLSLIHISEPTRRTPISYAV